MSFGPDSVCLITGATSGIGLAAARALAARGARVVVAGRNPEKGSRTVDELREGTGNPQVSYLNGDLSRQAEVRSLAEAFLTRNDRLDVLVNNAGGIFLRRVVTEDGVEKTFAVNHLAPFLLTNLLLDRLKASAPARIINVASRSHRRGRIYFDNLSLEGRYWAMSAYQQSKLANVLFTNELARRLAGTGVTANAMHPGLVATSIAANNGLLVRLFLKIFMWGARTPKKGAETIVYLATSPDVADDTGRYFVDKKPVPAAPRARNEESARRLWAVSEALVTKKEVLKERGATGPNQ